MKTRRLLSLLLAAVLALSLMSGCKKQDDDVLSSSAVQSSSASSKPAKGADGKTATVGEHLPGMVKYVAEKKEENSDTVGWLQIGHLGIDDAVLCNFESNEYYKRLNFEKQYDFNGVFYADRRSVFGDGSPEQLGVNTCIYGHAMTDDKDHENYGVKFGPLHDFRDPEIAKTVPYIFFTTEKEDLAFEVFAVFTANTDNSEIPYNRNDIPAEEFRKMVKEQVLPRSIYNYDVELKDDDKFLTLSTCIYILPNGVATNYPDTYYRYAIMGRLVKPEDAYKSEAVFTVNENPLIDPDGRMS